MLPALPQFTPSDVVLLWASVAALACGWWALGFAIRRYRRRQWFKRQADMRALRSMSWNDFERFTAELFRDEGYRVTERKTEGRDGGIDLILSRAGRKFVVQCKHYRNSSVGVQVIREMAGVAHREKAAAAFVVTVGRFTSEAKKDAARLPVRLIDGQELLRMRIQGRPGARMR
jgi:restriction system protein